MLIILLILLKYFSIKRRVREYGLFIFVTRSRWVAQAGLELLTEPPE